MAIRRRGLANWSGVAEDPYLAREAIPVGQRAARRTEDTLFDATLQDGTIRDWSPDELKGDRKAVDVIRQEQGKRKTTRAMRFFIRVTPGALSVITGIAPIADQSIVFLHNISADTPFDALHDSPESSEGFRILFPSSLDYTVPPYGALALRYDASTKAYRPITTTALSTDNITNVTNVAGDTLTTVINNIDNSITTIITEIGALGWPGVLDIDRNTGNVLLGGHDPNINTGDRLEFGNTLTHPVGGHVTTDDDWFVLGLAPLPDTTTIQQLVTFDRGLNVLAVGNLAVLNQLNLLSDVNVLVQAETGLLNTVSGLDTVHNVGRDWASFVGDDWTVDVVDDISWDANALGNILNWDRGLNEFRIGSLTAGHVAQLNLLSDTQSYLASNGAGNGVFLNAIGGDVEIQALLATRLLSALHYENRTDWSPVGNTTEDDLTLPDIGNVVVVRVTPSGDGFVDVTGIAGGRTGKVVYFTNTDEEVTVRFNHNAAGSAEANQLLLPGGNDLSIGAWQSVGFWYDPDETAEGGTAKWKTLGEGGSAGGASPGGLTWAQVLVNGRVSGPTTPQIDTGQRLEFGATPLPTGADFVFGNSFTMRGINQDPVNEDVLIYTAAPGTSQVTIGNTATLGAGGSGGLFLQSAGDVFVQALDDMICQVTDDFSLTATGLGDVASWDRGLQTLVLGQLGANIVEQVNVLSDTGILIATNGTGITSIFLDTPGTIVSTADDDYNVVVGDDLSISALSLGNLLSWDRGLSTLVLGDNVVNAVEQINIVADTGVLIAPNGTAATSIFLDTPGGIFQEAGTTWRADVTGALSAFSFTGRVVHLQSGGTVPGAYTAGVTLNSEANATDFVYLLAGDSAGVFIRPAMVQQERAASTLSLSAGQSYWWTRNDSPNTPWFTDDTNVDHPFAYGTVGGSPFLGWDDVLLNDRTTGVTVPQISATSYLEFDTGALTLPAAGNIRADGSLSIIPADTLILGSSTYTSGITADVSATISMTAGTTFTATATTGDIALLALAGELFLDPLNYIHLRGGIQLESFTDVTVSTTQNNWNITNRSQFATVRVNFSADSSVTGLANPADGAEVTFVNVGAFSGTFVSESASSTAANRFLFSVATFSLGPNEMFTVWYDTTTDRWRAKSGVVRRVVADPTWAQVLVAGRASGATNPLIDTGQYIEFDTGTGFAAAVTGILRSDGDFITGARNSAGTSVNPFQFISASNIASVSGGGIPIITVDGDGPILVSATTTLTLGDSLTPTVQFDNTGDWTVSSGGDAVLGSLSATNSVALRTAGAVSIQATTETSIRNAANVRIFRFLESTNTIDIGMGVAADVVIDNTGAFDVNTAGAITLGDGALTDSISLQTAGNLTLKAFTGVLRADAGVVSVDSDVSDLVTKGWDDVLAVDRTTGANSPRIDTAQWLEFQSDGGTSPGSGSVRVFGGVFSLWARNSAASGSRELLDWSSDVFTVGEDATAGLVLSGATVSAVTMSPGAAGATVAISPGSATATVTIAPGGAASVVPSGALTLGDVTNTDNVSVATAGATNIRSTTETSIRNAANTRVVRFLESSNAIQLGVGTAADLVVDITDDFLVSAADAIVFDNTGAFDVNSGGAITLGDGTATDSISLQTAGNLTLKAFSGYLLGTAGVVSAVDTPFDAITIQTFTADGTYTPTTGMKYCIALVTGGGAGGGGADVTAAGDVGAGGGGGAGETAIGVFTAADVGASKAVTIGTGGGGGSTAGGGGASGGTTSLGALITAAGAPTPSNGAAASSQNVRSVNGGAGGSGGSGGSLRFGGGTGQPGWALLTLDATDGNEVSIAVGGAGGASFWSGGTRGSHTSQDAAAADSTASTSAGLAPSTTQYGCGGGGGANVNDTAGTTGGDGQSGVCMIIEFT